MTDIEWLCNLIGINLYPYQKIMLAMSGAGTIHHMREVFTAMTEYERGYNQALEDINHPMVVVAEQWNPSKCPRCEKDFSDFEPCDDGFYKRATTIERCPFCGQKLDWSVVDW